MEKTKEYDKRIINRISSLIDEKYLVGARLELQIKADASNSIRTVIDNNPWRNDAIKGDSFFASIKSSGKEKYINFKSMYAHLFNLVGVQTTQNQTEKNLELIRINLDLFNSFLDTGSDDFVNLLNHIFVNNVSFSEFGCCSKFAECEKQSKCLHVDQLYATACQFKKMKELR